MTVFERRVHLTVHFSCNKLQYFYFGSLTDQRGRWEG